MAKPDKYVPLDGLHAVVTGGNTGIGLIITSMLLDSGARVTILNTNPSNAASAVKSLKATNPSYEINTVPCDVSNYASVLSAFHSCFSKYGTIDIVIANAGINEESQPSHNFLTTQTSLSPDSPPPLRALDVNLVGCLHTVYAALFYIRKNTGGRGGSILCTSSNAGIYPFPFAPVYAASKHAIVGFVRSVAPSLESENITINSITPSLVRTTIVDPELFKNMIEIPPSLVASAVKELVTNRSLTGRITEIAIEGEHGCLFVDPPGFPNDMTRHNMEEFLKLAGVEVQQTLRYLGAATRFSYTPKTPHKSSCRRKMHGVTYCQVPTVSYLNSLWSLSILDYAVRI